MIIALAKKGGVVQVNFSCDFLSQATADATKREEARIAAARAANRQDVGFGDRGVEVEYHRSVPRATLADVVAHIDHIVKIAGVNAAGIGSDFDGVSCTPEGLDDVAKFPNLTRALLEKGYSAEDIRKIYGGNLLRVMRATEAEAKRLRGTSAQP
jgi:membrane dipeptidase